MEPGRRKRPEMNGVTEPMDELTRLALTCVARHFGGHAFDDGDGDGSNNDDGNDSGSDGAGDSDAGNDDGDGDGDGGDPGDDQQITMTVAERNALQKKYIARGRRRAGKDVLDKFLKKAGLNSVEELEAAIAASTQSDDGNQGDPKPGNGGGSDGADTERERQIAAREAAVAERERKAADRDRDSRAIQALAAANCAVPKRALKLLDLDGITADSTDDEFADVVDELREDWPDLFTNADAGNDGDADGDKNKGRSGMSGGGRPTPGNPAPTLTAAERGRKRSEEMAAASNGAASPLERLQGSRS